MTAGLIAIAVAVITVIVSGHIAARHAPLLSDDQLEHRLRQALSYDMNQTGPWPGYVCSDPPCDHEDMWICDTHLPKGKHHPPPLRYGPEPIVGRCEWSEDMEARWDT